VHPRPCAQVHSDIASICALTGCPCVVDAGIAGKLTVKITLPGEDTVSAMTRNQLVSAADLQMRARKLADQASKLADQAGPTTQRFAMTAKQGAGSTAEWAKPHVDRARIWMAVQATNGSTSVQETLAPKLSSMLSSAALKLDPPKPRSRRWPKILAGISLLGAGGAAAAAVAMRSKQGGQFPFVTTTPPGSSTTTGQQSTVLNPSAEQDSAAPPYPADQRQGSAAPHPGQQGSSTAQDPIDQRSSSAEQYPSTWSS
jgi:hypothetical protein